MTQKTDILPVVPKSASDIVSWLCACVGTDEISAVEHIRNEGVDKHIDMNMRVSHTISTCSLQLRNIGLMHHYVTRNVW